MTPQQEAAIRKAHADARHVLKQGADRAANSVIAGLKPLSAQGAIAAKMLVEGGVHPGEAIAAAARVAGNLYMKTRLDPVGQDWAAISTAPTPVTINRLRGEF